MRRFIMTAVAVLALTVPAVAPAIASADVPRCQVSTTTATFSVFQPAGAIGQWVNVWQHDYTVTVNPDHTFSGTGREFLAQDPSGPSVNETITGTFGNGTVSFTANQLSGGQNSYSLVNAPTDTTSPQIDGTVSYAASDPVVYYPLEAKVTIPQLTVITTTDKNHGQYVRSQGGGMDAAQSCIGMPINSSK